MQQLNPALFCRRQRRTRQSAEPGAKQSPRARERPRTPAWQTQRHCGGKWATHDCKRKRSKKTRTGGIGNILPRVVGCLQRFVEMEPLMIFVGVRVCVLACCGLVDLRWYLTSGRGLYIDASGVPRLPEVC